MGCTFTFPAHLHIADNLCHHDGQSSLRDSEDRKGQNLLWMHDFFPSLTQVGSTCPPTSSWAQKMKRTATLVKWWSIGDRGASPVCTKPWLPSPELHRCGLVAQAYDPSTWQVEAGERKSSRCSPVYKEFKASLGYMGSCLKNKKEGKEKDGKKRGRESSARWGDRPDPKHASHWVSFSWPTGHPA